MCNGAMEAYLDENSRWIVSASTPEMALWHQRNASINA